MAVSVHTERHQMQRVRDTTPAAEIESRRGWLHQRGETIANGRAATSVGAGFDDAENPEGTWWIAMPGTGTRGGHRLGSAFLLELPGRTPAGLGRRRGANDMMARRHCMVILVKPAWQNCWVMR